MRLGIVSIVCLFVCVLGVHAQNTRINDENSIGWYAIIANTKLSPKFGLLSEYQFRRDNVITDWQQSLLRVGLNYQVHPNALLRVGYAWAETFAYGDYSINGFGKDFTEHRMYEMANLTNKVSIVDISHRFMLEQRWIGKYSSADLTNEDSYVFLNRLRYMYRMNIPLRGKSIDNKTPYLGVFDEILMGFGKNVNENIFDQNRFGVLLGYKFNKTLKVELGYLNQILQLGREIDTRNVFQHNNGLTCTALVNIDASKSK